MSSKICKISVIFFFLAFPLYAQLDSPSGSVRFDSPDSTLDTPTGFELPSIRKPAITNTNSSLLSNLDSLGEEETEKIDMEKGDGLMEYTTNKTPKYFTKDKEEKAEYGEDQYLGDFKTGAKMVTFMYRDHEYVDGDRISIFVNGEVAISNVVLGGSFRGFDLPLQSGFNKIDFQALNQGTSGPNTAQLQIFDEVGNLLASHEWNLLTGHKATVIVVKE